MGDDMFGLKARTPLDAAFGTVADIANHGGAGSDLSRHTHIFR
jgi:hypothetical protein